LKGVFRGVYTISSDLAPNITIIYYANTILYFIYYANITIIYYARLRPLNFGYKISNKALN